MSELYKTVGEFTPKMLLADPSGADLIAVPCKTAQGVVKAGTVMYRTENGMYAPASAVEAVTTNALVVLAEDVDTTGLSVSSGTVAEDAAAYRAGRLLRSKVVLKSDAPMTAAVELVLRKQGIFLDEMVGDKTYNNVEGA